MIKANDLVDKLDEQTVIRILAEHNAPVWKREEHDDHVELIFTTVCHHGHSHKLYWYSNSKKFTCYSHCGVMDVFQLIKQLEGLAPDDFYGAVRYLANIMGIRDSRRRNEFGQRGVSDIDQKSLDDGEQGGEWANRNYGVSEITHFYDPAILNFFEDNMYYEGWLNEGISEDTMRKYGIRWFEADKHIIIPHYNIDGKLVGIRRRSLNPEDAKNKYMPEYIGGIMYEHPTSLNLYGIYENHKAIEAKKKAVIVEGEKSVMLGDTWYGNNNIVVATCGFKISEWQIKALMKLQVETVYLGFDKDYNVKDIECYKSIPTLYEEALAYKKKIKSIASKLNKHFVTYIIQDNENLLKLKDSPLDRGKESYERLIKTAKRFSE